MVPTRGRGRLAIGVRRDHRYPVTAVCEFVRAHHPVGVSDGTRGARGPLVESGTTPRAGLRGRRLPPGSSSRSPSTTASRAAHVIQSTPRNSGSRDCGSAGYGCAPVKRRRRPVTEGGVGARLVVSLIDLPRRHRVVRRPTSRADGTKPKTTGTSQRARPSAERARAPRADAPCRTHRRTDSRRCAHRVWCWSAGRRCARLVRASPMRRTLHLRR